MASGDRSGGSHTLPIRLAPLPSLGLSDWTMEPFPPFVPEELVDFSWQTKDFPEELHNPPAIMHSTQTPRKVLSEHLHNPSLGEQFMHGRSSDNVQSSEHVPYKSTTQDMCDSVVSPHMGSQKHPATFKCLQCNSKFTRNSALQAHLRVHKGEKPFACDICNKRFTRNHDRKMHRRIHSPEVLKTFVCGGTLRKRSLGCGLSFSRQSNLNRHYRNKAGQKCLQQIWREIKDANPAFADRVGISELPNVLTNVHSTTKGLSGAALSSAPQLIDSQGSKSVWSSASNLLRDKDDEHSSSQALAGTSNFISPVEDGSVPSYRPRTPIALLDSSAFEQCGQTQGGKVAKVLQHNCATCGESFRNLPDLGRHSREAHDLRSELQSRYRCPIQTCERNQRGFTRKWNLDDHTRRRHGASVQTPI